MNSVETRQTLKQNFLNRIAALGQAAVMPTEKSELDAIVQELETLNPTPAPLASENRLPLRGTAKLPLLLGKWKLVYASNGTVVTRRLPGGIAIDGIWQILSALEQGAMRSSSSFGVIGVERDCEAIATINAIELGLPLLGKLQIQAKGLWQWQGETQTATVAFDAFSAKADGLFYQPDWQLPAIEIPVLEWFRREASWRTSYLDADLRIGRGASGNGFVFVR